MATAAKKKLLIRLMVTVLVVSLFISIFVSITRDGTPSSVSQSSLSSSSYPSSSDPLNIPSYHPLTEPDSDFEEADDIPLLTLFTTFKETGNSTFHRVAHEHAIANWASLRPNVHTVLFAQFPLSNLSEMARKANWDLIQLTRCNEQGTPFLKDMFNTVFQRYNSTFYGFANGDILFDESLIETLQEVKRRLKDTFRNNALLIGSRMNVKFSVSEVSRAKFSTRNLAFVTSKKGQMDGWYAQDYFFFTRDSALNWSSIVDVVIGRPGYDNYLVAEAIRLKVNVIDATKTLLAVHLMERGTSETGRSNPDSSYNLDILKDVSFREGLTIATRFLTVSDVRRRIVVVRRLPSHQYEIVQLDS